MCKASGYISISKAEAKIKFSYEYVVEGQADFIVVDSYEDLEPLLSSRTRSTSEGPLNLNVTFAPKYHLFREGGPDEGEVIVIINLFKEASGTAYIKDEIKINRLGDGVLNLPKDAGCSPPWGGDLLKLNSISEYSEKFVVGSEWPLTESHTYTCKYKIKHYDEEGNNLVDEDGERVTFILSMDYRYKKTVTKESINVVEIKGMD